MGGRRGLAAGRGGGWAWIAVGRAGPGRRATRNAVYISRRPAVSACRVIVLNEEHSEGRLGSAPCVLTDGECRSTGVGVEQGCSIMHYMSQDEHHQEMETFVLSFEVQDSKIEGEVGLCRRYHCRQLVAARRRTSRRPLRPSQFPTPLPNLQPGVAGLF